MGSLTVTAPSDIRGRFSLKGVVTPDKVGVVAPLRKAAAGPPRVMTRAATVTPVPNQPKTPQRSVRVPDEVWEAARLRAISEGRTLSDVVRAALETYAKGRRKS